MEQVIKIGNGNGKKRDYFLWKEAYSYTELLEEAKITKNMYQQKGINGLKSFIIKHGEEYGLYFNKEI